MKFLLLAIVLIAPPGASIAQVGGKNAADAALNANYRAVRCSNFLDQGQSETQHARNHEQESLSTLHPGV
jgi:hypothetical protein